MRDDDIVSIVQFSQNDYSPIDIKRISPIHFIKVSDLRKAFDAKQVSITQPKGVEEGSEIRVVWISAIANQDALVESVESNKKIYMSNLKLLLPLLSMMMRRHGIFLKVNFKNPH